MYMQQSVRIQHILVSDADYFALGCRKMLWDFRLQSSMCWGKVIDVGDAMLSAPDNRRTYPCHACHASSSHSDRYKAPDTPHITPADDDVAGVSQPHASQRSAPMKFW